MRKRLSALVLVVGLLFSLCACARTSHDSTFSVQFIDVGQGDAALVECDGHYMLIDGGDKSAGDKVYDVLVEEDIRELDYLIISHLHSDHYGGLIKALTYAQKIRENVFCNAEYSEKAPFSDFQNRLLNIKAPKITIPRSGENFFLGSAKVEFLYVAANENSVSVAEPNDSLVLLITYGQTRFLFTGDIEYTAQTTVAELLDKSSDKYISVIKMPHHGAYQDFRGRTALYHLIRSYQPKYSVISCGINQYGHPDSRTLSLLEDADVTVYRTDKDGDITVKSDGKTLKIETSK